MSYRIQNKENRLYILLAAFFLSNALLAELIGVKIFSFERSIGLEPLNWRLFGENNLSLNMSVGILIWPVVFILSDVINEYFGRSGVKRISFLAAGLIAYSFFIVLLGTELTPAEFWLEVNKTDDAGNPFHIDYAYSTIFRQGLGIMVGSITAFLVGQLVDMQTFHILRHLTNHKMLWLRATGSTIVSQLIDSFLVLFIAFYWLGNWTWMQVLSVGLIQYLYKISVAILLTPVIYWSHYIIDRYLGKEESRKIILKASKS